MTIVVDASVLVAALVDSGPDGGWAREGLASAVLAAPAEELEVPLWTLDRRPAAASGPRYEFRTPER